jgi:hypothetical protein
MTHKSCDLQTNPTQVFLPTVTAIYTAVTALTAAVRYKKTTVKSIKPDLSNQCQRFTARFVRYTARFLFFVPTSRTTVKKPDLTRIAWAAAQSPAPIILVKIHSMNGKEKLVLLNN